MQNRSAVQLAALLVGAVFVLVGILGFIPGITTEYDDLSFAGEDGAKLLGLFGVNVVHNIAHLALGVLGLALARTYAAARAYLIGGGIVYGGLFLFGIAIDKGEDVNFLALNSADDWLHLALGGTMVVLGLVLGRPAARERPVGAR